MVELIASVFFKYLFKMKSELSISFSKVKDQLINILHFKKKKYKKKKKKNTIKI